jgi:hypothetical protein
MATQGIVKFTPPPGVIMQPDSGPHKLRMDVPSSGGDRYYRVSFLSGPNSNYFQCSCPGCIRHGQCKHLTAMGLWGRAHSARALARAREIGLVK